MAENKYLTYKGYPLVRTGDQIYFGNMYDKTVVMLNIIGKEKQGDLEVANRIKVIHMNTDPSLSIMQAIIKQTEKTSLFDALDYAYVWLERAEK